jgi:hypothetical protein
MHIGFSSKNITIDLATDTHLHRQWLLPLPSTAQPLATLQTWHPQLRWCPRL